MGGQMVNQNVASDIFINVGVESWSLIKTPSQINQNMKIKTRKKTKAENIKDVAWFHHDSRVKQLK